MKKICVTALAWLMLLVILCSCGQSGIYLDLSNYGEDFRQENDLLFFNDSCEHVFVYTSASGASGAVDTNTYHMVKCNRGNCGYEAQIEPHVLNAAYLIPKETRYMENGYLYHRVPTSCSKCNERLVTLYVYCPLQSTECTKDGEENECLAGCNWEELLCDTPYVIFYG